MGHEVSVDGNIRPTLQTASSGASHSTGRFMAISYIEINK
jgi:hypothetical protein